MELMVRNILTKVVVKLRNERLLLVDDEKGILTMLETLLKKEGFHRIAMAATGDEALRLVETTPFDLIVLDVMLPDTDGFELCQQIRKHTSVPILFLTARSGDFDKLMGLGIGGDDYITKPFYPLEVVARIQVHLRRQHISSMLLSPQYDWNSEEKTVFLTEIQQKANHMEELIGDLNLSFQLDEQQLPVQWEKHDLVEFIRRIVVDVANDPRSAGSSLTFENDEPQMETLFDMKLLQRALHNLLLNAVLHNPSGTNIKVSITKSTQLQIVISDDGLGMDDKAIDRLFSKYYRGVPTDFRSEGTGLGMAIAKQLVLAHGGDILVTSEINK